MNIKQVKNDIRKIIGKKIVAKVNIGRNKYEIFEGIVEDAYPFLFTLRLKNEIKTFSYADILTKDIIIKLI